MKQKLALMCTLLHKPRVLFLDEPTNGVDPVSRRDFWAILYQLVRDGLTVFVTTAYLDEAERANRVGFMDQGPPDSGATPRRDLKAQFAEAVFPHHICRSSRKHPRGFWEHQPGVLTVQPMGMEMHLFLDPKVTSPEKLRARRDPLRVFQAIRAVARRLVFIALVRKQPDGRKDAPHAA